MIAERGPIALEAIDYELVWFGVDADRAAVGDFADAHLSTAPVWRLVAGYLMLAERAGGRSLTISSHGHSVAELDVVGAGAPAVSFGRAVEARDGIVRSDAGIALVPDAGTRLTLSADAATVGIAARERWGVTIVHGPADAKVENRIALLASLQRVGGRRG